MPQGPGKSAKFQANWPRNSRSVGRAQGMLVGAGAAGTAMLAREEAKNKTAGNKEFQSYQKGKVDGRQFDSSGKPTTKSPAKSKSAAPKGSAPMTKALFNSKSSK